MPEGLRLALSLFTVAPVARSRPARADRTTARAAMLWSPVVSGGLAAAGCAVLQLQRLYSAPLLTAALAVLALALLTRGLHLDGLADTVDGLASHRPADEALAVMRDGAVGALGAAALFGCLLLDVFALAHSINDGRGWLALLVAGVTGRLAMLWACRRSVPPARPDGMGALVARTIRTRDAAAWTAIVLAGAATAGATISPAGSVHRAIRLGLAVALPLLVALALRRHAVRRLGGITGDVLGGLCEATTLLSLLVSASG